MEITARHGLDWRALADQHRVEQQLARDAVPADVLAELESMRGRLRAEAESFKSLLEQHQGCSIPALSTVPHGHVVPARPARAATARLGKRREVTTLREISIVRGSLFPGGSGRRA
jgi:hypothetical protein